MSSERLCNDDYTLFQRLIAAFDYFLCRSLSGLSFALDPSSVPPSLHLSNSLLTVTYGGERLPRAGGAAGNKVTSDPRVVTALPEVCADVVIARGQYYWEVDVCNSSVYGIGKSLFWFV